MWDPGMLIACCACALLTGLGAGWWLMGVRGRATRARLHQALAIAKEDARTDPLTGLRNRKGWDEQLQSQSALARRYGTPFALVILDLDGLKRINDEQGHAAGDAVLRHVARVLRLHSRECDLVARYGGDEFTVLCPLTDAHGAAIFARRLCGQVAAEPCVWEGGTMSIRASVGVGAIERGEAGDALFHRVDAALFCSKRAGGNTVTEAAAALAPPTSAILPMIER